jgi:CheY-like chemotaxis protein
MRSILYIEDNLYNVQLIQRLILQRPNIELLTASLGSTGIGLAKERSPDLILLDVHLPDLPGYDVLGSLHTNPATAAIPVVILSADATPGQIQRFLDVGAFDYLTKPLDLSRLLNVLDSILGDDDQSSDVESGL